MTQGTEDQTNDQRTYRQRHRERRQREFLDAALNIVLREGLDALTMLRVTDELECSAGSIYQYFPTKGALIAEVQYEALAVLSASLLVGQQHLGDAMALAGCDEGLAALTRAVAAARFWTAAEDTFPQQVELCRRLFTSPTDVVTVDEGVAVLPSVVSTIELGGALLEQASAAGALQPGDGFGRTITLLAGTTGVLMTGAMARWDDRLQRGRHFADQMVTDLFVAWGASPNDLAQAESLVAELAAAGQLVPQI